MYIKSNLIFHLSFNSIPYIFTDSRSNLLHSTILTQEKEISSYASYMRIKFILRKNIFIFSSTSLLPFTSLNLHILRVMCWFSCFIPPNHITLNFIQHARIFTLSALAQKNIKSKFKRVHHALNGKLYYFADISDDVLINNEGTMLYLWVHEIGEGHEFNVAVWIEWI